MQLHLALNVTELDEAIRFYSTRFPTDPSNVKPGGPEQHRWEWSVDEADDDTQLIEQR